MATFAQFLNSFAPEKKGLQFEYFVKWFLKNDPEWSTQVDQIWLWDDYPDRWGPDCGIDLVFRHKNNDIWAVQAKCYSPEYSITKSDVDTFLSESSRPGIDKRLLIASTDQVGRNAKQVCAAQEKAVTLFLNSDFDKAAIEYPDQIQELNTAKRKDPPSPRQHQSEAIDQVEKGFKKTDHGQLIMACGTGKTFTTLWIKERVSAQSTLVLLPSLSLLSQTLREWTFASRAQFEVLCVCSDETVGKRSGEDEIIHSVKDISFPVTSDVREISDFLKGDGERVIFSTYQSSPSIAESQSHSDVPSFDLVVADEAHRCTGQVGNAFTTVLDRSLIRAKKRLFTTATPRTYSASLKKSASERGVEVTGMDDVAVFGEVLYSLPFGDAIKRNLLSDYQVVIIGVDKPMIAEWIQRRELVQTGDGDATDAKSLASQIGLIKAIKDYNLKRMISFHSRVKRAETFATEIHNAIDFVSKEHQPSGELWTDFVSGAMPTHKRRLKLDQLKELTKGDMGLLSNAKCLSEGVDVPSLDGVAFIDPRGSQVDIVQAVGRAIRLSKDKTVGTIVLPVFIEDGENAEASIQSSNFKPVWNVLTALKSHDEVLSFELDRLRINLGKGIGLSTAGSGFSRIHIDLPTTIDESFADALRTYLVEKTTTSWNFWFGLLETYVEREGHSRVPAKFKSADGYRLGIWVQHQRKKSDQLPPDRLSRLESLSGWVWDQLEFQWEQGFSYLGKYVAREGHARIPNSYKTADGYNLGAWAGAQRTKRDQLTPDQMSRLESLSGWVWDQLEFQWEEGLSYLEQYVAQEGHAGVPRSFRTADGYRLGQWVGVQRAKRDQLTPDRLSRLESLGFDWDPRKTLWEKGFFYLEQYVAQEVHARITNSHKTADGYNLGTWCGNQRSRKERLTADQLSRLESLGFDWDPLKTQWEEGFSYLERYVELKGNTRVPYSYRTGDGYPLGQWVRHRRSLRRKLTSDQISRLNSLGFDWDPNKTQWEEGLSYLEQYVAQEGHAGVPRSFRTADGYRLGQWVGVQRIKRDQLTPDQLSRLESLGIDWDPRKTLWEEGFSYLKKYVAQEGDARVFKNYESADGYNLGAWVSNQRTKRDQLPPDRFSRLVSLGIDWDPRKTRWEEGFSHLVQYAAKKGNARTPAKYKAADGYELGSWVSHQRLGRDQLTPDRVSRLDSLGFDWKVKK